MTGRERPLSGGPGDSEADRRRDPPAGPDTNPAAAAGIPRPREPAETNPPYGETAQSVAPAAVSGHARAAPDDPPAGDQPRRSGPAHDPPSDPPAAHAGHRVRWRVTRVETMPMTSEQFEAAAAALAVLITEWTQTRAQRRRPDEKAA